jgi:hypothetical protein
MISERLKDRLANWKFAQAAELPEAAQLPEDARELVAALGRLFGDAEEGTGSSLLCNSGSLLNPENWCPRGSARRFNPCRAHHSHGTGTQGCS